MASTTAATTSAAATTAAGAPATAKDALNALYAKRSAIEKELSAAMSEEKAKSGGRKVLVDEQGFPLADVDVHAVRIARNTIARLQTDYRLVMKQIEALVFTHFQNPNPPPKVEWKEPAPAASAPASKAADTKTDVKSGAVTASANTKTADNNGATAPAATPAAASAAAAALQATIVAEDERFAAYVAKQKADLAAKQNAKHEEKAAADRVLAAHGDADAFFVVNSVWENSPATNAGLKTGDRIVAFGSINRTNNATDKQALPRLVSDSVGRAITVVVRRPSGEAATGGVNLSFTLVPQKWSGNGLLGCHILPC